MKLRTIITFALGMTLAFSCKDNTKKDAETPMQTEVKEVEKATEKVKTFSITLLPKSESSVEGTVTFEQIGDTVTLTANMTGLSEGSHAIHIHEKADCTSADGTSAGGHWNPTAQPHGKWGDAKGYHKGDIGNFEVSADGSGTISLSTEEWCIGCGDDTKDILGKSIIVHQGKDDFVSQPSGAAGARVSCAGIIEY